MNRGRSTLFAVLLGVAFIAGLVWAGWDTMQRSGGMLPNEMSETAFARATPSSSARLIMEVLSVDTGGRISGRMLKERGGTYRLTPVPIEAQLTAESAIVMGDAADIKPRAVLQLSGSFDDRRRVRIARAVVLTGYVTVER